MENKCIILENKGDEKYPRFECTKATMAKYGIDITKCETRISYVDNLDTLVCFHTIVSVLNEFGYVLVGKGGQGRGSDYVFTNIGEKIEDNRLLILDNISLYESFQAQMNLLDKKIDATFKLLDTINEKLNYKKKDNKIEIE